MFPNKESLKRNKFIQSLKKFSNSNFVAKILVGLFVWGIALIPVYIYLLFRWLIDPMGFWQEFALILGFAVVIGWVQGLFLFLAIILTIFLIFEDL